MQLMTQLVLKKRRKKKRLTLLTFRLLKRFLGSLELTGALPLWLSKSGMRRKKNWTKWWRLLACPNSLMVIIADSLTY